MGPPLVHLITDRTLARDLPARVDSALDGMARGSVAIQLRE
jgi:hypothetical protein